jgi:hypothetical protein
MEERVFSSGAILDTALGLLLFLITLPFAARLGRHSNDARVATAASWGLVLKLVAAPLYLWVFVHSYNNIGDFNVYHSLGVQVADAISHHHFQVDLGGPVIGTGFIGIVTGIIYSVIGASKVGGFIVFSWLAYLGLWWFFRAYQITFPDHDHRRYARLVFLLPSLVFWTAATGKDAWMCLTLGLATYGIALTFRRRNRGLLLIAVGLTGGSMVRAHVVFILLIAFGLALLIRKNLRPDLRGSLAKLVTLGLLVVGVVLVGTQVQHLLGVKNLSTETLTARLDKASQFNQGHTYAPGTPSEGYSSAFNPNGMRTPWGYPWGLVTVLFRPFPLEASGPTSLAASFEGVFLVALVYSSRRRVAAALRRFRREPFIALIVIYVLACAYVFTSLSDFGLLARERVQILPLFLVLCSFPADETSRSANDRRDGSRESAKSLDHTRAVASAHTSFASRTSRP